MNGKPAGPASPPGAASAAPSGPDGAVVVGKAYDLLLWLLPKVEKFPRSYRGTVGQRLTGAGLDLLADLTEAAYTRDKTALLMRANRAASLLRLLLRLAKDLHLLAEGPYRFATERLDEVGRMIGGWLRATLRRAPSTQDAPA